MADIIGLKTVVELLFEISGNRLGISIADYLTFFLSGFPFEFTGIEEVFFGRPPFVFFNVSP